MAMNFSKDDYRDTAEAKKLLKSNPSLAARIKSMPNGDLIVLLVINKVSFPLCKQKRQDRKLEIRTFKTYDAVIRAIKQIGFLQAAIVF